MRYLFFKELRIGLEAWLYVFKLVLSVFLWWFLSDIIIFGVYLSIFLGCIMYK